MNHKKVTLRKDVTLHVYDNEKENAEVILYLHGLTGNYYQLQFYYDTFKDNTRFIAIDFRGRGDSGQPQSPSSLFEHKRDVIELLEQLKIKNPIIMGYSMGGFVAALVASEIKVNKLILLDGAATMDDHQDQIVVPTFDRLSNQYESKESYVETVVSNYAKMGVPDSPKLRDAVGYEIREMESVWLSKSSEQAIRTDWASFHEFDITEIGPKILCPTLLVQCLGSVGNNGALFEEKHYVLTKKHIQNLEIFKTKANHYTLVFEKREDVIDAIQTFLTKGKESR